MAKLAVLILTYNEEANIADCIQSAAFADEIVVVDSGSTDKTVELATSLGAHCVYKPMRDGFAAQRNFALTQTNLEWVLFLDADERITPALAEEIRWTVTAGDRQSYEILRVNVMFGRPLQHGVYQPDWSLRLYPRDAVEWEGVVHEQAKVSVSVRRLRHNMFHYTYTNWERYFFKFNQYTTMMAEQMQRQGKQARFWQDIVLRPYIAFFKMFVIKKGFLDGRLGFTLSVFHFFYTMAKYVKFYWLQKQKGA